MNSFQLFGLKPSPVLMNIHGEQVSAQSLKQMYVRMQSTCHPDLFAMATALDQQIAATKSSQLTDAYRELSQDLSRVKCWLALQGVDLDAETVQPDIATFELQMRLNESLAALDADDSQSQHELMAELGVIRNQVMDWFLAQTDPETTTDYTQCLKQFSALAMTTRLAQRIKDLRF